VAINQCSQAAVGVVPAFTQRQRQLALFREFFDQFVATANHIRQRTGFASSSELEGGENRSSHVLFLSNVCKAQVIL
jgi:hypothetical protein